MANQRENENDLNDTTPNDNPTFPTSLIVIIQTIQCSIDKSLSNKSPINCVHRYCPQSRGVLNHIRECDAADACPRDKCPSTISLLKHIHGCDRSSCACASMCPGPRRAAVAAFVRELLLRNQYLIWRRKIVPFRSVLIERVSDKLVSLSHSSHYDSIRHQLAVFDDSNFRKSRGISTYLANFSKYSVEILMEKLRSDRLPDEQIDISAIGQSIFTFLRNYSTDVLQDRVKLEPKSIWTKAELRSVFVPVHNGIVVREKRTDCCGPGGDAAGDETDRLASFWGDLATIGDKLMSGSEYDDPWDIVADYWAVFERWGGAATVASTASVAVTSSDSKGNRERNSKRVVSRVARLFGELADGAMRSQGLCCGRLLEYAPLSLICCVHQCSLLIGRDEICYRYIPSDTSSGTDAPQIVCCESCFHSNPQKDTLDITIATDDGETDTNSNPVIESVKKRLFEKQTNNAREREEMIECVICHRKWHRVCAGHLDEIWPSGFYCPRCESSRPYRDEAHPVNPLTSSRLPHTPLSQHIESRIDQWRKAQTQPVPVITIRILSSREKLLQIKPEMKRVYVETGELQETLPYEQVSLFAFQKISDSNNNNFNKTSEICLFGMQCQQFSSDCPQPNSQRVYLAYLDSVQYFQPAFLRTEFYHRLLIAYLEFCSLQGFLYAHIWACPPADGDEYIFHCHPPQQKLPKPKRLQEWYVAMLDKAIKEGIINDYCDIFTYAFNSKLMSVSELPYFEGDYWPNALEELLQEIAGESSNLDTYPVSKKRKKIKKVPSKLASKRRRQLDQPVDNSNEESCSSEETVLMKRLFDLLERRKDNFLVVRLSNNNINDEPHSTPLSTETTETSLSQMGELMDGRDRFLSLCREKRLEFSSERRARFATLSLCYELHLELNGGVLYSCNRCHRLLIDEERYTCLSPECVEFELCVTCSQVPRSHPHQLTRVSPHDTFVNPQDLPNQSDQSVIQSNAQSLQSSLSNAQSVQSNCQSTNQNAIENKRQQLAAAVRMLQHSFSCRDTECRITNCLDWKKHLTHMSQCRSGQNCGLCQRLERLCALHVKLCRDTSCAVPACVRNRRMSVQSRLLHATSERRRIDNENNDGVRRMVTPYQANVSQFQQFPSNNQIYIIQNRTNPNQNHQLLCVPRNTPQYHQTYRSFPTDSANTNNSVTYLYKHPNVITNNNPHSFSNVDSVPNNYYLYNNNNNNNNSNNVCSDIKVIPNFNQNICYNTGNMINNCSNIAYTNNKLLNTNIDYNGFSSHANMMQINANNAANTINTVRYNGIGTTANSSNNTQRYVVSNASAARTSNPNGNNNNFVTRIINTNSISQRNPNISIGNDNYSNRNAANTFINNSGIPLRSNVVYMNNVNTHHGNVNISTDSDNTTQRYASTTFTDGNNIPLRIINGHNISQRNGSNVSISGDTHSNNTH